MCNKLIQDNEREKVTVLKNLDKEMLLEEMRIQKQTTMTDNIRMFKNMNNGEGLKLCYMCQDQMDQEYDDN